MSNDQPEIDFSEDIKGVISLPWRQILTGAFLFGIFIEANWEFGIIGIVMLYPAWKLLYGSYYSLRHLPSVANWVYQSTAKADASNDHLRQAR